MQYLEYMAAAYAVIWVVILLYFLSLARREKQIWDEVSDLRARIAGDDPPSPSDQT